ncbi:hypothetical protein CUJ84_Chr000041 [Rhizobium leguminosarum]|uniref:Uncharacterized protein n=1 Tax=Rhizobium leguminosarum TaxID=384 RepID=A0A2K9YWU9_RHILE|nr:hypothetical protein CUJ84_Chr000041 [Rhizobium leguminosarum]
MRGRIEQTSAELGEPAAEFGFRAVVQDGLGTPFLKHDIGAASGEAGKTALAFGRQRIALRRVDIGKRQQPVEGGGQQAELDLDRRLEGARRQPLDALTAWNAATHDVGIVECCPDDVPRRGDAFFAGEIHSMAPSSIRSSYPSGKALCQGGAECYLPGSDDTHLTHKGWADDRRTEALERDGKPDHL